MSEEAPTGRRRRADTVAITRMRIMEAAERLFADGGIEGVSLREIAVAAGQKNIGAVQYHFGTKERLVYDMFEYRTQMFEPLRDAMLLKAEQENKLSDVRTLFEIVCRPHLTIADIRGKHPYSAFLAQYVVRSHLPGMPHPYENPEAHMPALRRVRYLLARCMPNVPADLLQLRFQLCKLMFLNALMRYDSGTPMMITRPLETVIDDTFRQMTAAWQS